MMPQPTWPMRVRRAKLMSSVALLCELHHFSDTIVEEHDLMVAHIAKRSLAAY